MFAMLRPHYYLRLALPTLDDLDAALSAAARIGGRAGAGSVEPATTMFAVQIQERLGRAATARLRALVDKLPARPDLAGWRTAVDVAAQRAALASARRR